MPPDFVQFAMSQQCNVLGSIVVSIPACHAGDRGSIPRRGEGDFDPRQAASNLLSIFQARRNTSASPPIKMTPNAAAN